MDLIQLYIATRKVVESIETSGLMPALGQYRSSLRGSGDRTRTEATLVNASDAYLAESAKYNDNENAVVNLLHLGQLGTASFWRELTSNARSIEARQGQAVSAYSKMMFATNHLPCLLALVRETSAVETLRTTDPEQGSLVLRLFDSVEPAACPDRVSRTIDAVDLVYTACTSLTGKEVKPLCLMSISGVAVRSLIFHGDGPTVAATQRVIKHLNETADQSADTAGYSVENIAARLPFLDALQNLQQIGTISAELALSAGQNAREGAIMLLESGAQLIDGAVESAPIPASVVARLDADGQSFDAIDESIGGAIDDRYNEVYEIEKNRLMNSHAKGSSEHSHVKSGDDGKQSQDNARGERGTPNPMAAERRPVNRDDNIDDLLIDLNRLYGQQH